MSSDDATTLLSLDVAQVAAAASAAALDAQRSHVESLSDAALFEEAAAVEAELAKALAVLQRKSGEKKVGPTTMFEGVPYDCGALAAAAIGAAGLDANTMAAADLEALVAKTELELQKATAALERKKKAPAAAAASAAGASARGASAAGPSGSMRSSAASAVAITAEKTGMPPYAMAAAAAVALVAGAALLSMVFRRRR